MTDREYITRLVGEAAGAASLCWDPRPEGEFDSALASKFVDEAVDAIMRVIA